MSLRSDSEGGRPPSELPPHAKAGIERRRPRTARRTRTMGRHASTEGGIAYQTSQLFFGRIGVPFLHWNASANAALFASDPFTRNCGGECGSTVISILAASSRAFEHQAWPAPRKNC